MDDLETAIINAEAVLNIVLSDTSLSSTYPNLPTMESNLSCYLGRRYDHHGRLADLDLALEYGKEAVRVTVPSDHCLAGRLGNLSNPYDARYQRLDDMGHLNRAIEYGQAAVEASTLEDSDQGYTPIALDHLSSCLYARYTRTLDQNYLEAARSNINKGIGLLQACIVSEGRDLNNDAQYISSLNNLSTYLEDRFKLLGGLDDLETAIRHSERVLTAMPKGYPNRLGRINGLTNRYHIRYLALGNVTDLEKYLTYAKALVEATPANHRLLASRLMVLSNRHRARFDRIGDIEDLNLAISYAHNAQVETPPDHPRKVERPIALSEGFHFRYERFGKVDDLEAAIHQAETALASTPHNNLRRRVFV